MAGYFAGLPPLAGPHHAFDDDAYRPAPDAWLLAVTDIAGSTQAIAEIRPPQAGAELAALACLLLAFPGPRAWAVGAGIPDPGALPVLQALRMQVTRSMRAFSR
jgi:hypothetical protein